MIWTIIGAAIMFFALIGVAFAANAYYDAPLSGRWRGPDGYPILRDYHAERCPCDRCIWVMRGTIDRLERELGIGELDMSRLTAESVAADRLFPAKVTDE